jgi:Tol biopolymer transport system component
MVVPEVLTLATGVAEFDVAQNGTLVYASGQGLAPQRAVVWVDRSGREQAIDGAPERPYGAVRLSPDATQIALEIDDGENDIWVWHLARHTLTRVTSDPGPDEGPIWMPDGRRLIFTSQAQGALGSLFRQSADGSGTAERLTHGNSVQRASAVLPDGTGMLFDEYANVMLLKFDHPEPPRPAVARTSQVEQSGVVSPDGRWLAYVGADAGPQQVFLRPFPNVEAARTQVSPRGGSQPVWARNGRELFYLAPDGGLMSVPVPTGGTPGVGAPSRVFQQTYFDGAGLTAPRTYDVSPDGHRFLLIKAAAAEPSIPVRMVVVLNWFEDLTRAVPLPPPALSDR